MTTYTFRSYPASAEATFTCSACGKPKRKRTFRHECTVNPFNTKEDGSVRTPEEVRQQSREMAVKERDRFITKPLCRSCEDALSWVEQRTLREERNVLFATKPEPSP